MALIRCKNGHLFSDRKHGKICPYCNISAESGKKANEEDPLGLFSDTYLGDLEEKKPVVGWIVCVAGPSRGKDYRIVTEKNFLGRSPEMDIRVVGDDDINARNHAVIVYDPEKNQTFALPGDSRGLIYKLDDEDKWRALHELTELQSGDRLKIGQSQFIFVPLCGKNEGFVFNWKENAGDNAE